jgi:hypothetical protein
MKNKELIVDLVNSILRVLDRVDPSRTTHLRCGQRSALVHQQDPRITLDLERLRRTRGDLGAGSSRQALADIPNPRVRVVERPPPPWSPSPDPPAYWPMAPSDLATSPRSREEPLCAIHGGGSCPYPVTSRQLRFTPPGQREGGREGGEVMRTSSGVIVAKAQLRWDTLMQVLSGQAVVGQHNIGASGVTVTKAQLTLMQVLPR